MMPLLLAALLLAEPSADQAPDAPTQLEAKVTEAGPEAQLGASALIARQRANWRLRLGIGGGFAKWVATNPDHLNEGGGLGFGLDFGVQLNDRFALYARGAAETILFTSSAYGAVVGEVGFDHLSIGTGVGWMGTQVAGLFYGSGRSAGYLAIPIVLGITPGAREGAAVRRTGFHIWVDAVLGVPLGATRPGDERGLGWYGSIKFGYVWR
jgi:hypothetical protein